ncbi:MAG: TIGR03943 family protein [Bifidobacterium tibiigranuli]|jgi:putative membrane protein|uniref:TIGR03943 family putative permease subunit n=1 Tax=Bifidobacterium tibiigranuli TaxID=2172043 RepID=UPI002357A1C3|nr:TIGR03943 family protein [Bifidobacterium tibiigranuli]MCH3974358.1 TIGR03943 family protein [Bifidobacterium tibiigranuli]MCH4188921.1 TIGR03943 family protein [Bifidobacterium tibiigranuli]MCH4203174.1 TIGR03943 family protein [Bifidobacterium tibiigranuli]MCH4273407.1 TIGR03943 family protein [Bifidobacterium tibiigranuli]MCI1253680.1 TIGR03943 family protein [Bifidobacterium tibiigranuli]
MTATKVAASPVNGATRHQRAQPNAIDRIEGLALFAFAVAIAAFVASGRYISFVTPRTVPYLVFAAIVLLILALAAWFGVFNCTKASLIRILVVAVLPTLLLSLPIDSASSATTGTNRAIAINSSQSAKLPGLNAATKTITIRNDDFGSWFDRIDRHADQYLGYTIIVEGSVTRDSSVNSSQFSLSRMLMTCCVLDMTPFGFVVDTSATGTSANRTSAISASTSDTASPSAAMPKGNAWVKVTGTLARGRIGTASHGYNGLILKTQSIHAAHETSNGYFYR